MIISVISFRKIIKDEFQKLRQDLVKHGPRVSDWISPEEAREILGVGRTKYFELKNKGVLTFSQHGRIVKISRKSVEDFLKINSIE